MMKQDQPSAWVQDEEDHCETPGVPIPVPGSATLLPSGPFTRSPK